MGCPDETAIALLAEGGLPPGSQAQIEAHVDHCSDCRELLAMLARASDVPAGAVPNHALSRGDMVERYVVLDRLGAGGMGIVYSAFDPDLDRRVALKLLRDDVLGSADGDEARSRLLREAKALARLNHPNVLTVYQAGAWCGQIYLALEFIDGEDVSAWLKTTRSAEEVLALFRQAGEGLAAAHSAGLVHRDFKPSNLLVDNDGRARVADFGLAAFAGERLAAADPSRLAGRNPDLTPASAVMGTPGYIAPEQVENARVDARADQFAFCVALYEALCGHRPFKASHDSDPIRRLMREGEAMAPQSGVMKPRLWQAIKRGLELDPAKRHPNMEGLLAALAPKVRRSAAWGWALVGVVAVGTAVGIGGTQQAASEPTREQIAIVDGAVADAREAADAELYLYPPPGDPQATTAYRAVLSLERIDDESRALASTEAIKLRDEFAGRLVDLAADVWDRPGGRAYALDLYAVALVFDPEKDEARTRAALTPGELALLRSKAAELEFTEAELVSAEPLIALAEPDAEIREERLRTMTRKRKRARPKPDLDALVASLGPTEVAAPVPAPEKPKTPAEPEPGLRPAALPDVPTENLPGSGVSPGAGARLAKQGRGALSRGELDGASSLFLRALSNDPKNHAALIGLADIAFERGRHAQAIRYAQKAVRRAPKRAKYRITLGDALFAELRYKEAKAQYEKASSLGSKLAKSRLARVANKLGR